MGRMANAKEMKELAVIQRCLQENSGKYNAQVLDGLAVLKKTGDPA